MRSAVPLRVLDLTDGLASSAGRLFVGLGADVIRIEDAGDRPASRAERLHWHAGKRVVRVADDRDLDRVLERLLPGADVVVESGPTSRLRTLSRRTARPADWEHVAHVVVTPFGTWGPCRDWLVDDLVATAAGGMAWLGGDPGGPPIPPPRAQAGQLAGTHAAIAALLALLARRRTGRGQLAEVSVQEAVAATLETGAIAWIHAGTVPGRTSGVYGHVAHRVFAAKDGYVAGGYSGPDRMWNDLLAWMAEHGEAADLTEDRWQDPAYRWRERPYVDEVVAGFIARRTVDEIAREALARALPWTAVATSRDLTENPQLRYREFFVDIDTESGPVRDVGFPYASPGLPRPIRLTEPRSVDTTVTWAPSGVTAAGRRVAQERRGAALDGVRVLDLTWVLAGPYVTKILGEHGADIVKVESAHRQDPTRFAPSMRLRPGATPDDSGYFLNFNRNKRSLALNLRTPAGQQLLHRLVAVVDVVVENFSPGVLERWGLGYQRMREINPDVVLVSMAGVGQTGPWHRAVTFADTLAAMSGLTHETGRDGRPPQGLTFGLGDMVAANAATLAALELLYRGHGGHVDLSQLEAMAAQLGPALVEDATAGVTGLEPPLPGVFRTRGDDCWIAIGAVGEERLRCALAALTAEPLAADLRVAVAETAVGQDADVLAAQLQERGIPAYPVRDGCDLVEHDPQLAAGGFYVDIEHPLAGRVAHEGLVARLHDTPGGLWQPAPLLGQHTDELLTDLLGLTPEELAALHDEGVLS
ncbi:MAG: CoA transferase [Dactylosporangium sp.]|jgi:crotonobetainyl-CoA:carnitine CoA-transferase CaiB-like acyl-CoA transferase|nr:CoA transferase [Dactylosporangium sp.]